MWINRLVVDGFKEFENRQICIELNPHFTELQNQTRLFPYFAFALGQAGLRFERCNEGIQYGRVGLVFVKPSEEVVELQRLLYPDNSSEFVLNNQRTNEQAIRNFLENYGYGSPFTFLASERISDLDETGSVTPLIEEAAGLRQYKINEALMLEKHPQWSLSELVRDEFSGLLHSLDQTNLYVSQLEEKSQLSCSSSEDLLQINTDIASVKRELNAHKQVLWTLGESLKGFNNTGETEDEKIQLLKDKIKEVESSLEQHLPLHELETNIRQLTAQDLQINQRLLNKLSHVTPTECLEDVTILDYRNTKAILAGVNLQAILNSSEIPVTIVKRIHILYQTAATLAIDLVSCSSSSYDKARAVLSTFFVCRDEAVAMEIATSPHFQFPTVTKTGKSFGPSGLVAEDCGIWSHKQLQQEKNAISLALETAKKYAVQVKSLQEQASRLIKVLVLKESDLKRRQELALQKQHTQIQNKLAQTIDTVHNLETILGKLKEKKRSIVRAKNQQEHSETIKHEMDAALHRIQIYFLQLKALAAKYPSLAETTSRTETGEYSLDSGVLEKLRRKRDNLMGKAVQCVAKHFKAWACVVMATPRFEMQITNKGAALMSEAVSSILSVKQKTQLKLVFFLSLLFFQNSALCVVIDNGDLSPLCSAISAQFRGQIILLSMHKNGATQ